MNNQIDLTNPKIVYDLLKQLDNGAPLNEIADSQGNKIVDWERDKFIDKEERASYILLSNLRYITSATSMNNKEQFKNHPDPYDIYHFYKAKITAAGRHFMFFYEALLNSNNKLT
jgi:hypothetical protein